MRLTAKIKPNAQKNEIIRWFDKSICKIAVTVSPTNGLANRELVNYLSERLDIPKRSIEIIHGHGGRKKLLKLPDSTQSKLSAIRRDLSNRT